MKSRNRSRRDKGGRRSPAKSRGGGKGRFDDEEPQGRGRGRRGKSRSAGGRGFDWDAVDDDDDYEDEVESPRRRRGRGDDDDYDDEPRRPSRRRGRRAPESPRLTLMQLCTPVFGYAVVLPQEPDAPQPTYRQFRDEVLTALKRIETEAPQHGIETEDARQAVYALCFFLDTQVAESSWNGRGDWSAEPLGIVLQQDPEGGVNFFRRLESFGDRHSAVKEVYLVCLSLGFRGKYAEQEATQQAAQLGEIRQNIVRSIHPEPFEKQQELFPEAYQPANPIEDQVPAPPRWWMFASFGVVLVALLIYVGLFFIAKPSQESIQEVKQLVEQGTSGSTVASPEPRPATTEAEAEEDTP